MGQDLLNLHFGLKNPAETGRKTSMHIQRHSLTRSRQATSVRRREGRLHLESSPEPVAADRLDSTSTPGKGVSYAWTVSVHFHRSSAFRQPGAGGAPGRLRGDREWMQGEGIRFALSVLCAANGGFRAFI